jgi:hypothetical protein
VGAIFERLGMQAVVEMAIFVFILALGLLYAYRKKVLQWGPDDPVGPLPKEARADALGTVRATVYKRLRKLRESSGS